MNRKQFFELIMTICDWDASGDDEKILSPLVEYLAQQPDETIFSFDEIMSELLFELDTKKNFRKARRYYTHTDDSFLYSRCCALINGEEYYEKAKAGKVTDHGKWNSRPFWEFLCVRGKRNTEKIPATIRIWPQNPMKQEAMSMDGNSSKSQFVKLYGYAPFRFFTCICAPLYRSFATKKSLLSTRQKRLF